MQTCDGGGAEYNEQKSFSLFVWYETSKEGEHL